MSKSYYRRTNCRLCRSKNISSVLRLVPTPVGDHYVPQIRLNEAQEVFPLELFLCRDCWLAQLLDVVDPNILYGAFTYTTAVSLDLDKHFSKFAAFLSQYVKNTKDALVLDVGSNDGTLLRSFKEIGYSVVGVDPAKETALKATAQGIETIPDFFTSEIACEIAQKKGKASIVTLNNTFANIDDVDGIAKAIHNALSDDGIIAIETGDLTSIVENGLFDTIYHEHLSYFSVRSLKMFFERHGFELFYGEVIPTKGGSIRCLFQRKGGARSVDSSVAMLLQRELHAKIGEPERYQVLENWLKKCRDETRTLLERLKQDGKCIAGYGASVGSTTLLYHFELSNYLDCIYDDNPVKFNTYSPGVHVPVKSSSEIYNDKPDYIVIISFRYKDPITKRHHRFVECGGRFVSCFPEVHIIE